MQRDTTRLHRDPKQLQRDKKNDYGDKKHLKGDVNDHKVTKPQQGYSLKWLWRDVNYHRNATQLRRGTIYHKRGKTITKRHKTAAKDSHNMASSFVVFLCPFECLVVMQVRWAVSFLIVCPHTQQQLHTLTAVVRLLECCLQWDWEAIYEGQRRCVFSVRLWWFVSSNHAPAHTPTHTNSHPANSQLSSLTVSTFLQGFTVGSSAADFLCTLAS